MGLGVYIHFPYCVRKCEYCDFASYGKEKWPKSFDEYVSLLKKELNLYYGGTGIQGLIDQMAAESTKVENIRIGRIKRPDEVNLEKEKIHTVYFGGGTPSLMEPAHIEQIMDVLRPYLSVDTEVTMECNPGTVNAQKLMDLHEAGINRLSIGLQAAQDRILRKLGRIHSYKDFEEIVGWAKAAGFMNISADIMFGLPDQTMSDWRETLTKVIEIGVTHISAYGLKVEEDTAFDRYLLEGSLVLPEVELERAMYHRTCEILEENGYEQYEISNFAIPGMESKHNLNYWERGDYIGIGLNSHSKLGDVRYWNAETILEYEDFLFEGKLPISGFEILRDTDRMFEQMILSLRLNKGLDVKGFVGSFGEESYGTYEAAIKKNINAGLLEFKEDRLCFTKMGRDLSNQVYLDFMS